MAKNKKKFYGVKVGRTPGVYDTWDEAEAQVKGFEGALHKSFATRAPAEKYVASPPAPGFVSSGRASVGGGGQRAVFAYPAELMDGGGPAGAEDLEGEDLPVPTADDAVGTAVRTDDHTPPPDDAPTTAPRWFDPSASTRPTSTEARATWGAPTAPSRLVDPLHATRPTVDYYDPPQQQQQTQQQQQRARSTRRGSDAAHDLHYDHENGTGWETAPGKRTRDAFGVGVSGRVLPKQPEPARDGGFPMGGVSVHFPKGLNPHVPQKITMSKVIAALRGKQNALIESPTGTGKSLSLLCSALAWQEGEKVRIAGENDLIKAHNTRERMKQMDAIEARKRARRDEQATRFHRTVGLPLQHPGAAKAEPTAEKKKEDQKPSDPKPSDASSTHLSDTGVDGVVVPAGKTSKYFEIGDDVEADGTSGKEVSAGVSVHAVKDEKPDLDDFRFNPGGSGASSGADEKKTKSESESVDPDAPIPLPDIKPMLAVPRIYLCSRTHSQLHQLVKELKRTPYRPKYTILGSRAQYCPIKKSDDECSDLTKNKASRPLDTGCGYYNKKGKLLSELEHAGIWDMEDMAEAAEAHRSCKFFAMKDLLETAELVLCPYNYVFDPGIRNALGIELGNAAVIIDEGHNVEDVCREGASFECSLKDLDEGVRELRSVVGFYSEADPALVFMELMYTWLDKHLREAKGQNRAEGRFHGGGYRKLSGPVTPGPEERLWKGEDGERALLAALCPTLASAGGNPESLRKHALMCVDNAIRVADYTSSLRQKINNTGKSFGESSLGKCYNAAKAVRSLLTNPRDYVLYAVPDLDHPGDDGFNASRRGDSRGARGAGVAMWCLRPSVAFGPVSEEAMCVIVTSGTLSPIGSLEGELGVQFPIKVEAPHVVPRRQIHVEALDALGDFTAKTQDNPKMPANLASLLLKYLKVVPKGTGALVFLPKYALIRRIMEDWEYNGVLSQLKALVGTVVAEEPGAQTFAGTLEEFRGAVEAPDNKGALMLAVYRGKVSEGLDFKDDFARAVFCVGIPFPSVGDVKVRLKREYNSSGYARQCGLMPGGDWYSHQAFRAYNQALGRCIRHQHDYAAIFMVDARFGMSEEADRNKAMVSKWMRNLVQRFRDSRESVGTLAEFFERLTKNPPGPPPGSCTKETTPAVKTSLNAVNVDAKSVDVKERTPLSTQDEVLGAVDVTFTQAERLRAEEAVREGRHVDLTMSDEDGDEDDGAEEGGDGVADVLAASAVALPE